MNKKLFITILLLIVLLLFFSDSIVGKKNLPIASGNIFSANFKSGNDSAALKLKIIGITSSKISSNYVKALEEGLSKEFGKIKLNEKVALDVEFVGGPSSRSFSDILTGMEKDKKNNLLVLAPDVTLTDESAELINRLGIPAILYSNDAKSVCFEKQLSKYIWNLGVPTEAYNETFLSFINQKYSKLAQDLRIFIYSNEKPWLVQESNNLGNDIEALGFKLAGKVVVDDRIKDIYATVRQIYDYTPRVVLGLMSRKGLYDFMPVASKLGLTFELGVAFYSGVFEEDLIEIGDVSKGVLVPTPYLSDLKLDSSVPENEKEMLMSGLNFTSQYQASILSGIIHKLFFRGMADKISFSEILAYLGALDGVRYFGASGLITVDVKTHGLIQPMHVGEFRDGKLRHVQALGDVSLAADNLCN